ncbi:MAG: hypothetical protein SFZ24_01500 [Planctomycetota bacterium]|nr:hypothetical protein [Planctomycetota bacterium]
MRTVNVPHASKPRKHTRQELAAILATGVTAAFLVAGLVAAVFIAPVVWLTSSLH